LNCIHYLNITDKKAKMRSFKGTSVLSSRGYAIPKEENEDLIEALRTELTVEPRTNPSMPNTQTRAFPVYRENSKKIYLPRVYGIEAFGPPRKNNLHSGLAAPGLVFSGTVRPEQEAPVAAFLEAVKDPARGGGLLVLPCAFGKTALSLYLACQIQRKTLVICHKEFLMNQWRERIATFVPTCRVGLIKGKHADTADKDVVLATLQSIAMKDYPAELFAEFGFVIIDETHHIAAEVFSRALPKITAPAMLGLTATPDRKDGLRRVFEWFLGRPVYEIRKRADTQLEVKVIDYDCDDPEYCRERTMYNGRPNIAALINAVCAYEPRTDMIIGIIKGIMEKERGRKILVLSDRRAHLDAMNTKTRAALPNYTTGFYVGGMKQEALDASATCDVIFATTNMAAEGLDIPALNTLILSSPMTALEQPIGRIQRQKPHERTHTPLVIDIWDKFSVFLSQGFRRMKFYKKNRYTIIGHEEEEEAPPRQKLEFLEDED
jgi:superfamily II DNA or RNA helicase